MTSYGHAWRTQTRPHILARDGYRCRRCGREGRLDVAHLDQNPANDDEANLAALCRLDHRRHDIVVWRTKSHETRARRKDAARPAAASRRGNMTIAFENVGREKMAWKTELRNLSDESLIGEIRSHAALRSQGIDFAWNEDGDEATILVGGFRPVGTVRIMSSRPI